MNLENFKQIENKPIVVDTNILVYCGDKKYAGEFKKLLRFLYDNKNKLIISVISGYEIFKKFKSKKDFEYYLKLLNYVSSVPLNAKIANNAGIFANENKSYKIDNDVYIGATALSIPDALLLTSNFQDFRNLPFSIKEKTYQLFEEEGYTKTINIFLLEQNKKNYLNSKRLKKVGCG